MLWNVKLLKLSRFQLLRQHSIMNTQYTGAHRPVERGGSFPGPRDFWGARRRSKILKMVFQMASFWPKICIKSIFGRGSAPDPAEGAYDAPPNPLLDGEGTPRFLPLDAFGVSISRRTGLGGWWVIGPSDNVFPGPAVALDGPGCTVYAGIESQGNVQYKFGLQGAQKLSNWYCMKIIKCHSYCKNKWSGFLQTECTIYPFIHMRPST